jgi:hypothetical protein
MKTKIDELFETLLGNEYYRIKKEVMEASNITNDFGRLGIIVKEDSIEIDKDQFEKLIKIAESKGIKFYLSSNEKLTKYLSKGKQIVKIGELPVTSKNMFLLATSSEANLYVLTEKQQVLIQVVFDYFQKEGEWPLIREIASKFMKDESVTKVRDSLPRSLYIPDYKICKLTLFGIFHAKGCDTYKSAISDIANILIEIINKNPKQDKIIITKNDIPYFTFINNIHEEAVFWMLGEPWGEEYGPFEHSISINIPNDPLKINSFTDPITFVKSYYSRWEKLPTIEKDNNITQKITNECNKHFDMTFLSSKNRREIVSRYIEEAEIALHNNASIAAVVLYGATLECILFDILTNSSYKIKNETGKNIEKLTFKEMIDVAHNSDLITTSSKDLAHGLREYRNLIHPERCKREKLPTQIDAEVAKHIFLAIIDELKNKK